MKTELVAWQCPQCHRWHTLHGTRCRCGYVRTTHLFSANVVAVLVVVIGILLTLWAGDKIHTAWPEGSGAYMEVQYGH